MYVLNKKCEMCGRVQTCCEINTVHITETGNELPKRAIVCPACLLFNLLDIEDAKTNQRKGNVLTRIK